VSPSDIHPGLQAAPLPDLRLVDADPSMVPFLQQITVNAIPCVYLGIHGGFANWDDFQGWIQEVLKYWNSYDPSIDGFSLSRTCMNWAIGILWPDQSYASISFHHGDRHMTWGPFHHGRVQLLQSTYTIKYAQ
jgi:hypothetical protein